MLSFALMLILARTLGPEGFAHYSVLLNAGTIALIVIEGGYPQLLYRETAASSMALRQQRGRLLSLACGSGVLFVLLLAFLPVGFLLGHGLWQAYLTWWAVLACMLLAAWLNVFSGVLRGEGRFTAEAVWQVTGRVFGMAAILVAVAWGAHSVMGIFLAWGLGLLMVVAMHRNFRPPFPSFEQARQVRQMAFHLMLGQLLWVALMRLDLLVLAAFGTGPEQAGQYSVATRFFEAGVLLFAPVANVLLREFRLRLSQNQRFSIFMERTTAGAMLFALAGTLLGCLTSPWLVVVVFGREYADAAPLLGWVLSALIFFLPGQVLAQAAIALDKERLVWAAYALGLVSALVSSVLLVPSNGVYGTAWSMLIGHVSVMLALMFGLHRRSAK